MRSPTLRYLFAWSAVCLLCVMNSVSAEVYFPVQIEATQGTLPPQGVVELMAGAPEVMAAAAVDAGLNVVGSQNKLVRLRLEDKSEIWVRLSLNLPESMKRAEDATTLWGILQGESLGELGEGLNSEQAAKLQPIVQRIADAWVGRMEFTLSGFAAEPIRRRYERSRLSSDLNAKQYGETKARIEDAHEQLRSLSSGVLPTTLIEKQLSEALTQQQSLEVELAGLEAKRRALEERIAIVAKEMDEKQQANDDVASNLQKMVDLRAKELDIARQQVTVGRALPGAKEAAEVQLLKAENELANARRNINDNLVESILSRPRGELADATIRLAECKAKKEFVERLVEKTVGALQIETQQAQPLREKLVVLQRQLDALEAERFELSRNAFLAEAESRPVRVRKLVPEPVEDQKPDTSP